MQMMAQLTQGQTQLNQAMTEAMSQQLQINRNVERSVGYQNRSELKGIPKPTSSLELPVLGIAGGTSSVKIVAQVEAQCDKEVRP